MQEKRFVYKRNSKLNVGYAVYALENDSASSNALMSEITKRSESLIKTYGEFLGLEKLSKARTNCYGKASVEEYERYFFINCLLDYRIWQVDEAWLINLQNTIEENDSAWLSSFLHDVQEKKKRLEALKKT